jgi:hypothetical protein
MNRHNLVSQLCLVLLAFNFTGCGGGQKSHDPVVTDPPVEVPLGPEGLEIPDNSTSDNYLVLAMGNSHALPIGDIIETLIESSLPGKTVSASLAPGSSYLVDRISDGLTLPALESQQWTHVILQAQQYSTSRSVIYPTTAAETWIRLAKKQGATPILFPEHPQKGDSSEGRYVYDIHDAIAKREKTCVAPIGLAWDEALKLDPTLALHSADGNHAAQTGALLTAMIFYQIITGEPAISLPYIDSFEADEATQMLLRQIVEQTLSLYPACQY